MASPMTSPGPIESLRVKSPEVKMYESSKERKGLDDLADLYAIIKATEALEAAYSRDACPANEYTDACKKLISHFKTAEAALVSSKAILSADMFMREYQIDCPRAYERLVIAGTFRLFAAVFFLTFFHRSTGHCNAC